MMTMMQQPRPFVMADTAIPVSLSTLKENADTKNIIETCGYPVHTLMMDFNYCKIDFLGRLGEPC
jgi:hypothetical protein